jgi:hypothetical protein
MNNVFQVSEYLKSRDAKLKYELWEKQLLNYTKETIYIKNQDKHINKDKLLSHLTHIKYIIYGKLPHKYGGIGEENITLLNSSNKITESEKDDIYNRLFHLILTEKDIITPLCNCCLTEFSNKDKGWKTTKDKETEYFKDDDGIEFISSNYLHVCDRCHCQLKDKIPKYNELHLIKFNKNVFSVQTDEYMEYQPICFKLVL